jgi:hypothetical protein
MEARLKEIIAEVIEEKGALLIGLETTRLMWICWWRWSRSMGCTGW